jgi:hypothetical protein
MKKKDFAVGDRVAHAVSETYDEYEETHYTKYRYDPDAEANYGVITSILTTEKQATVKWDNEWYNRYNDEPVNLAELMHEEAFKKLEAKLEEEFNEVEKEVEAKMKDAAKLIKEANKLAKKTGRNLESMYEAVSPLVSAMDASGWRSSSWGC